MKCLAINTKNKPNDIQTKNWIKKGEEYNIVSLKRSVITKELFLVLEEVQPDPPYGGYKAERFSYDKDTLEKLFNITIIENIDDEGNIVKVTSDNELVEI
jgi:hypothetical protein